MRRRNRSARGAGPRVRIVAVALASLAMAIGGCHRHHRILPTELEKLDGWQYPDSRPLVDLRGRTILFTRETPLTFALEGRRRGSGRASS